MNDAEAIAIAGARLAMDGFADYSLLPGVVQRPPERIVEVQFSPPEHLLSPAGIFSGTHSVFVKRYSNGAWCVGGLNLGQYPVRSHGHRGKEVIEAALHLFENMFDPRAKHMSRQFTATIVDPPNILAVYYAPEIPEGASGVMGGDVTVYLVETGVVINVLQGQ